MNRHEHPTFTDWWIANEAEYRALSDAQDGNPTTLADLIRSAGTLKTRETREFVADRLEGKKNSEEVSVQLHSKPRRWASSEWLGRFRRNLNVANTMRLGFSWIAIPMSAAITKIP